MLVDKPVGVTSHDVVAQLRRRLGERRIGHAGTLDPPATGLLVIGVGAATRLLRFVTELAKTYEATICFGAETTTGDAAGEVLATHEMTLDAASVRAAAQRFVGTITQVPPAVSAVKVDGRRAHAIVRSGETPELAPRTVRVYDFNIEPATAPDAEAGVFSATVTCGSGTYIRSLAVDLGRALGGSAHLGTLRRVASGPFTVSRAQPPADAVLLGPETIAEAMEHLVLAPHEVAQVAAGGWLEPSRFEAASPARDGCTGRWALLSPEGKLVAVHERKDGVVRPAVVLPTVETSSSR